MATGYNYQPLSAARGEIRLLSLEEKWFRSRGRLECQLHHLSLYDAVQIPEYFAISYAWGNGTIKRRDMIIDGKVVSVPESADDALRYTCRQSDVPYAEADSDTKRGWVADDDGTKMVMWSGTSGEQRARHPNEMPDINPSRSFWTGWAAPIRRYIWIDAICINQADLEERSQQVKLMGVVYRMAKRVLVWLGHEDALTKAAIESIYLLYKQAWEATDGLNDLYGMVFGEGNGWTLTQHSELPLPDNCNWAALCEFYSARWFERLWIIQEVTLAHRTICYRGPYIVDGQAMFVAATWMRYRRYEDERYCGRPIKGIDSAALLCDYLEAGEQSLFSLLDASMRSKSSDPKDKVFGMLGLMSSEVSTSLNPDYLRSLKDIYAEATVACIRERKKPCILSLAQAVVPPEKSRSPGGDWPSWVPHYDWVLDTMEGSYLPFPSRGEKGACRPREAQELESLCSPANAEGQNLSYDNFMAAMSKIEQATERTANVRDLSVSDDWSLLHLKGVIFDTVESVGTPNRWPQDKSWNSLALDLLDDFRLFVASAKRASGAGDDQSFTQAWTSQVSVAGSDSPVAIESSPYFISNDELTKSASAFTRWCHGMIDKTIHNWSKSEIQENSLAGMAFLSAVRAHGTNRKIFRTRKGNLGIASHGVEKGDRICILFGGSVPFALREEGKYWRLVSDAFVANIMNVSDVCVQRVRFSAKKSVFRENTFVNSRIEIGFFEINWKVRRVNSFSIDVKHEREGLSTLLHIYP